MKKAILAIGAAACLFLATGQGARADVTENYDFSGTVTGNGSVTGTFTVDFTTSSLTAFNFSTPTGTVDSSLFFPDLTFFTATNPSGESFVELFFQDVPSVTLELLFETDLAGFETAPSTSLYTGTVDFLPGNTASGLLCVVVGPPCTTLGAFGFTGGTASLVPPAIGAPEPGSFAMLGAGLAGLGALRRRCKK